MVELQINQLIKIIIAAVVIVVVIIGLGIFFKDKIFDFFNNLPSNSTKLILSLL